MNRNFIPGECTVGSAAESFLELERVGPSPVHEAIAVAACQNCIQLEYCRDNKKEIAETIRHKGADHVIVAGEIIEPSLDLEPPLFPDDTRFRFDLSVVPREPRLMLELARQAFRAGQISPHGTSMRYQQELNTRFSERLAERDDCNPEMSPEIVLFASRAFLKYRFATRHLLSRQEKRLPPGEDEYEAVIGFLDAFVDDSMALAEASCLEPAKIALVHSPAFFDTVMAHYGNNPHITLGRVRDIVRDSNIDPVSYIESYINKNKERKRALNNDAATPDEELLINEGGERTARSRQNRRDHPEWRQYEKIPELRTYITKISGKSTIEDGEITALYRRAGQLRAKFPDVAMSVLAYAAYHYADDPESKVSLYCTIMPKLRLAYGDHPGFSDSYLCRIAIIHLGNAPDIAAKYAATYDHFSGAFTERNVVPSAAFLRYAVQSYPGYTASDELVHYYGVYKLRSNLSSVRSVDRWILDKIVDFLPEDQQSEAALNVALFLRRGYARVRYASDDSSLGTGEYPLIDKNKGAYLELSPIIARFSADEQAAILTSFHLDRIMLGREVDRTQLLLYFDTDDLDHYVDTHLLSHCRQPVSRPSTAEEKLYKARFNSRDSGFGGNMTAKKKQAVDEARIYLEEIYGDTLDQDQWHGVNLILKRLAPTDLRFRRILRGAVDLYLSQAEEIAKMGIKKPLRVALAYDPEFCRNFLATSRQENSHVSPSQLGFLLGTNLQGQAVASYRRYHSLVTTLLPHFNARDISSSYCRILCMKNSDGGAAVAAALSRYDAVNERFMDDWRVGQLVMNYYCFSLDDKDPIARIEQWIEIADKARQKYGDLVDGSLINRWALSTGRDLTERIETYIDTVDSLKRRYGSMPHPALDETIYRQAAIAGSPGKWLGSYLSRWADVRAAEDVSDISLPVLRRLVAMNKQPINSIAAYRKLRAYYEFDDYIDGWMVDDAVIWSVSGAGRSLRKLRNMLRAGIKQRSLSHEFTWRRGGTFTLEDTIADASANPEELYINKEDTSNGLDADDERSHKTQIATALHHMTTQQKTAIALVYDLPWLVTDQEQEFSADKIRRHFGATDSDDLKKIVDGWLQTLGA